MFQKPQSASMLNSEIERLLTVLNTTSPDSDEYKTITDHLTKLHALKVAETPKRVSRDTWVLAVANFVGVILVLQHEKTTLIPKTAMSFVKKAW
jgi:hypothetical protein